MKILNFCYCLIAFLLFTAFADHKPKYVNKSSTICNPLNLSYRFSLDAPSRREAADPTVIMFKNEYYLFASKTGGYWHSNDLINWDLITSPDLPFEDYAPAAVVMHDTIYFIASSSDKHSKIFKSASPKSGRWTIANVDFPISMTDPDLFLDTDGRLYFYYGCSDVNPIYGVELDVKTLNPIGTPIACFNSHRDIYGWEQTGDYNNRTAAPWIEGAWMTKHLDKYYLQYAAPGTQFKSYGDGLYTSDNPLGPFKVAAHNPVSLKPEGFIAGAGHSSTFQDKYGNYWHISTMTISVKHMFERRLGLFPMFFDSEGVLYTYTGFGDFPMIIPKKKMTSPAELFSGWMLLSYNKPVQVSSSLTDHPKEFAVDENVRTYWSAKTGHKNEWLSVDLQKTCTVNAVQINFAEHNSTLLGRSKTIFHQYLLEYSDDGVSWKTLVDKSLNNTDVPHDYIQLKEPVKARFMRITNVHIPDGMFALSGLRVFGTGQGFVPQEVKDLRVIRTPNDKREVKLKWSKQLGAVGYNIQYGIQANKLYHTYQVLHADSVTIRSLNRSQKYYFSIDAFNENGIKKSTLTIKNIP